MIGRGWISLAVFLSGAALLAVTPAHGMTGCRQPVR